MILIFHLFSTGSGDVDTSKVVKADDDGCIRGASGWARHSSLFIIYIKRFFISYDFECCFSPFYHYRMTCDFVPEFISIQSNSMAIPIVSCLGLILRKITFSINCP